MEELFLAELVNACVVADMSGHGWWCVFSNGTAPLPPIMLAAAVDIKYS